MSNVVASLLHPKLLILLVFVMTIMVIYHDNVGSWHYVWIPLYIHDTLLTVAFGAWLRKAYTRPLKDRLLYGFLWLAKLTADVLLPMKLDGLSSVSHVAAVVPLMIFLALLLLILGRDMRNSS
jgi:hypothetical protein